MNYTNIQKHLRNYRDIKDITQEELSIKLYTTRGTIANWENGRAHPKLADLTRISELLNVSVEELKGERPFTPTDYQPKPKNDEIQFALFGGNGDFTEEEKKDINNYIEYIKSKRK